MYQIAGWFKTLRGVPKQFSNLFTFDCDDNNVVELRTQKEHVNSGTNHSSTQWSIKLIPVEVNIYLTVIL